MKDSFFPRHRPSAALALVAAALFLAAGCADLGNYNSQMRGPRTAFARGQYDHARNLLQSGQDEGRLNPWLELGVIEHTAGAFKDSSNDLQRAGRIIRDNENKAVISASKTAGQAATLVVNERAQPYYGESFEKILIHTLDAVNYLMQNDWEGARVEVRRAYDRQRELAKQHEDELAEAKKTPAGGVDLGKIMQSYESQNADQQPVASRVANAYQNAFTNYISAVVYNAQGEANDAYIELKAADQLRPGAECMGPIMIETAAAARFQEDLAALERKFGLRAQDVLENAKNNPAEVIVLFENGWAPVKGQITIPIPTPHAVGTLALPKYELQGGAAQALRISAGAAQARTAMLGDVEAQAVRALRDRMAAYVIKGAIRVGGRLILENAAYEKTKKEKGADAANLLAFASSALNVTIEQADLRAWTLLPKDMQVARLRLPEGKTTFNMALEGGDVYGGCNVTMNLRRDRPNVILVRSTGGVMIAYTNEK